MRADRLSMRGGGGGEEAGRGGRRWEWGEHDLDTRSSSSEADGMARLLADGSVDSRASGEKEEAGGGADEASTIATHCWVFARLLHALQYLRKTLQRSAQPAHLDLKTSVTLPSPLISLTSHTSRRTVAPAGVRQGTRSERLDRMGTAKRASLWSIVRLRRRTRRGCTS